MSWQRSRETKRRNKNLYEQTKNSYARGCWYNEEEDRIVRYQISKKGRTSHVTFVKKQCNRRVRRNKHLIGGSKGHYRKMSELWWEVF